MHDARVRMKDGRLFVAPIWESRFDEGWFSLISDEGSGIPDRIYIGDVESVWVLNDRLGGGAVGSWNYLVWFEKRRKE